MGAVGGGARRVPRGENRLDRGAQLLVRIVRRRAGHDPRVRLGEAPPRVTGELCRTFCSQSAFDGIAETEIEQGVHHPRHRDRRAGAHADQQRTRPVSECPRGRGFQGTHSVAHVIPDRVDGGCGLGAITRAHLGGDAERRRHRQAVAAHHVDPVRLMAQNFGRSRGGAVQQNHRPCGHSNVQDRPRSRPNPKPVPRPRRRARWIQSSA